MCVVQYRLPLVCIASLCLWCFSLERIIQTIDAKFQVHVQIFFYDFFSRVSLLEAITSIPEVALIISVYHSTHSLIGIFTQEVPTPGCVGWSIKHLVSQVLYHQEATIIMYLVRDVTPAARLYS